MYLLQGSTVSGSLLVGALVPLFLSVPSFCSKRKIKQLRIQKLKTASNVFEQSQVQKAYQKPNKSLLIDKKVASTTWWGCSWMEKTKTKNSLFGEVRGIYQLLIWVMLETDLFCALLP